VRVQELVGDVSEDRGTAGRDAAFGGLDEEAGEEIPKVFGGGELGATAEKLWRQVGGVIGSRRETHGFQAEMPGAKTGLALQGTKTAAHAIVIAMLATGVSDRGIGCNSRWSVQRQYFHIRGLVRHDSALSAGEGYTHPRHCCKDLKTKELQIGQFVSV